MSSPSIVGFTRDNISGVCTVRVRIEDKIYTYMLEPSYYAEKLWRARDHFNFGHLNILKKFGRLVVRENLPPDDDEED